MRGPAPKPTALRILEGNPGKRPLPQNEPQPQGDAVMPDWLRPGAVKLWNEYAPLLTQLGVLTVADSEAFGQWCSLAAMFRRSPAKMPASKMARMDALTQRFGLDPGSRARIQVKPRGETEERFFETGT